MKKAKAAASKEEDLKMGLDDVYIGTKVGDSNGFWIGSGSKDVTCKTYSRNLRFSDMKMITMIAHFMWCDATK